MKPSSFDLTPPTEAQRAALAARLSPEAQAVLLYQGTEPPFCGGLTDRHEAGLYVCAFCGLPLFSSTAKFHSGTGWPSFFQPVETEHIHYLEDQSHGMVRTEIRCRRCDAHLGHVFPDGPPPTGQRYCLNSVALDFVAEGEPLPDPLRRDRRS